MQAIGKARQNDMSPPDDISVIICSESLSIISANMCSALKEVFKNQENGSHYPKVELRGKIESPYTFFYHGQATIKEEVFHLPSTLREAIRPLMAYFEENFADEFRNADRQFHQAQVSSGTIQYLFEPGQVVIQYDNGELISYCADSYLQKESSDSRRLHVWSRCFDGAF
jgi:hypothetical protein